MSRANSNTRTMYLGTLEYLTGGIGADIEVTDSDTIEVSFDKGLAWHAAEWVGPPGISRQWRLLLGSTIPLTLGRSAVYVRITDNPEVPIVKAGTLNVVNL